MFYNARNGAVELGGTRMQYICFGRGQKPLVFIPGVGDGIRTVKGAAVPLALMFRRFAKGYRAYAFSRKERLEPGCSTKEMARDLKDAMEKLGLSGAHIVGVSQGGMIAQHLAADYPQMVDRLVLAVTLARANEVMREAVGGWIQMAEANDFAGLFIDTAEKSYTEAYLKKFRRLYPILCRVGRPKDLGRFILQAEACLGHDACEALERIACPTFVIGGDSDRVVGGDSSRELAQGIRGSRLLVYEGLGHGAYEEAKDFQQRILDFLESQD